MTTITKGAPRPEPAGIHRRGFLRMLAASGAFLMTGGAAGMVASASDRAEAEDIEQRVEFAQLIREASPYTRQVVAVMMCVFLGKPYPAFVTDPEAIAEGERRAAEVRS